MFPYLTPERYRSMGFLTEDVEDEYLASYIARASASVDRYCAAPVVPARYSFRGGTVTDEEHPFHLGDGVTESGSRIIWPFSTPLRTVTSLRVYVTNSQYIDFDVSELFVTRNNVNIVSLALTSIGLFGAFSVPVIGLGTAISRMSYTYGFDFDAVDEVLVPVEGKTYRAQNQFWNADVPVVKVNDAIQSSGYTIDKNEGIVVFDTALTESDIVEASYGYTMPSEIAYATGLTVAQSIGEGQLIAKGMAGVEALRVGEISIERPRPRAENSKQSADIPNEAKQLLDPFRFITVR